MNNPVDATIFVPIIEWFLNRHSGVTNASRWPYVLQQTKLPHTRFSGASCGASFVSSKDIYGDEISILHCIGAILMWTEKQLSGMTEWKDRSPGSRFNINTVLPSYGSPMLEIRRSRDRLIFNMGILIMARHLYIETVPWCFRKSHN